MSIYPAEHTHILHVNPRRTGLLQYRAARHRDTAVTDTASKLIDCVSPSKCFYSNMEVIVPPQYTASFASSIASAAVPPTTVNACNYEGMIPSDKIWGKNGVLMS